MTGAILLALICVATLIWFVHHIATSINVEKIVDAVHSGTAGALRMGLLHGAYCLGCCCLLFVILFPLAILNIAIVPAR